MRTSSIFLRKALAALAEQQGGCFTAEQAISIGYADAIHGYHLKAGHWERLGWGIYRLVTIPRTPWTDLHRVLLWSRNKRGEIQGAFCGQTALAIELGNADLLLNHPFQLCVPMHFRKSTTVPHDIHLIYKDFCNDDVRIVRGLRLIRDNEGTLASTSHINPNKHSAAVSDRRDDFFETIRRGED